jgi:hypothetical protein
MHDDRPQGRTHSDESRDEALDRAVRALPRELAPARDLWPALGARLPERRQQRRRGQAGLWAAAAALGALWFATLPAPVPESQPLLTAALPLETQLQAVYETVQAAQLATLNIPVHPELLVWDEAIDQVLVALQFYPEDPYLLDQLDRLYRQRLQALQHATLNAAFTNIYY